MAMQPYTFQKTSMKQIQLLLLIKTKQLYSE